jgi:hypothetical protein
VLFHHSLLASTKDEYEGRIYGEQKGKGQHHHRA